MAKRKKAPSRAETKNRLVAAADALSLPGRFDVAVVGGGASGLVAAIAAAEAGARTVVLERSLECGEKILATGNGRCNFANEELDADRFNDPAFVAATCGKSDSWLSDVLGFWRSCGLAWTSEEGRLYPLSLQAASVRSVLLRRAENAGVVLATDRKVSSCSPASPAGSWTVKWRRVEGAGEGKLAAAAVVLASGAALPAFTGTEPKREPFSPVLCPIAAQPVDRSADLGLLCGRRAKCRAALLRDGDEVYAENGEVLFRPEGLSGIVVFDLSRRVRQGDVIELDLARGLGEEEARALVDAGGADGVLDPAIASALGGGRSAIELARKLRFEVAGLMETNKAQVMRGGLCVDQFSPASLEAKTAPGLHACGEALDVDADCGGFNLAWAWKSGMVAGAAAAGRALGRN